ncbi:MAG: BlaI/MecI/CopY family transcriptional regulator [Clostridia bacterium]|nr:BlaI/MecI/CopY family transcriptional regulator [Clostridia bacterium]
MSEMKLGAIESRFADIIWQNEPLSTAALVAICERQLSWKRTTTYTVLKRLSERGIFKNEGGTVTSLISRGDFYSLQSEKFVEESFDGSLPAFFAAFTSRKKLTAKEISEIRRMIDSYEEE